MPPMPPIPPIPPPIGGIGGSSFGSSVMTASAVVRSDATPAASFKAMRTTLAGSIIPASIRFKNSPLAALYPNAGSSLAAT